MSELLNPFPCFTETTGHPIDDGYVYIGTAGLDAQDNQIAVFWDSALTQAAAQPLRTSGGYIMYQGAVSDVFVSAQSWSIKVLDKQRRLVFGSRYNYALAASSDLSGPTGASRIGMADGGTVQDAVAVAATPAALIAMTDQFPEGVTLRTADGFIYAVAASGVTDQDVTTAGGVKLYVVTGSDGRYNVVAFGAIGDGVTNDTAAIQAALDTGKAVYVPDPPVTYLVDTLVLAQGQTVEGAGQFSGPTAAYGGKFQFTGNGVDPVFLLGDGTGAKRQMTLRDLSAYNDGADVVKVDTAPNTLIERVRLRNPGNACGINLSVSYRVAIRDCWIAGLTGIKALNNCNGLTIENVTCTGGSVGRAMQIGQSQGIRIVSNIIESSYDGIWIGGTSDVGDGNCNGVLITANYFEQVGTPLVLGKQFSIVGLECVGNFISNAAASVITYRTAMIQFGRIRNGLIANNALLPINKVAYPAADNEDLFWMWMEVATHGYDNLIVRSNAPEGPGAAANVYVLKGAFAANNSVKQGIGSVCNFTFMGSGNPLGSDDLREWISPEINTSATYPAAGNMAWLTDAQKTLGGKIHSVNIFDWDGGSLAGASLQMGRIGATTENVSIADMSTLVFANGSAPVTLASSVILDGSDNVYRVSKTGASVGKFRIRVMYKAN